MWPVRMDNHLMPFTLAHPLLAIPFMGKRRILLSAVVIGCLSPDFEYYLQMTMKTGRVGHMGWGILYFSIPVALIALWVFHAFLKPPLLALLPFRHQRQFAPLSGPFPFFPIRRFLLILSSLILGVALHVSVDLFTHADGWQGLPVRLLETPMETRFLGPICLSDMLQAGFSGAGLLWLFMSYRRWIYRAAPGEVTVPGVKSWLGRWNAALRRKDIRLQVLIPMIVVAGLFGIFHGFSVSQSLETVRQWRSFGGRFMVGAMAVFFFQLLIFALFWKWNSGLRTRFKKS